MAIKRSNIGSQVLWCLLVPLLHHVLAARGSGQHKPLLIAEQLPVVHQQDHARMIGGIAPAAVGSHQRALHQAPASQGSTDWINQKVQAITDMIITVRQSADNQSTAAQPAPPLNVSQGNGTADASGNNSSSAVQPAATSPPGADNTTSTNATRGDSSTDRNSSSILQSESNPNAPVVQQAAASVNSGNHTAHSGNGNSSSTGPIAVDAAVNATAPLPFRSSAGNNGSRNASSANSTSAAAAAQTAIQLLTLLSDLQPDTDTSSPFNKVDYGDNVFNTSGNMPLAVPVDLPPDITVSRWVLAAWSVTNHSTPLALKDWDLAARRKMLLGNFTQLQPQQVQTAVTANVTVPLLFQGVEWKRPASRALQQAAAEAAGGYTQALVQVAAVRPDYGVATQEFLKQDVQYSGNGVTDKAVTLSNLPVTDIDSSSSQADSDSNKSSDPRRRLYSRKLLQQQQQQHAAPAAPASPASASHVASPVIVEPMLTRVWVQYRRLDASNVTALLAALSDAFDIDQPAAAAFNSSSNTALPADPIWPVGRVNISSSEFGVYTKKLLNKRGARTANSSYAVFINGPPLVTTNMRLAAAVTESQTSPTAALSTDQLVALWMSNASNIVGPTSISAAPIPDQTKVSWLLTPEVWTQPQTQHLPGMLPPTSGEGSSRSLSPGAIAGIAVSGAVAGAALIAGVIMLLISRVYRQQSAYKAQQDDAGTEGSSGGDNRRRRRRRHMKPRYLLPEIMPHLQAASSQSAAAAAAAAGEYEEHHDDEVDPEQLRAQLRELGDSVTSAARYERYGSDQDLTSSDDDGEEEAAGAGQSSSRRPHAAGSPDDQLRTSGASSSAAAGSSAAASSSAAAAASAHVVANLDVSTSSDSAEIHSALRSAAQRGDWSSDVESPTIGRTCTSTPERMTAAHSDSAAASGVSRVLSPTTASLALTGASSSPWQRLTGATSRRAGLATPFANYVFDAEPPASNPAVAAIRAAYAKAKSYTSRAGSTRSSAEQACKEPHRRTLTRYHTAEYLESHDSELGPAGASSAHISTAAGAAVSASTPPASSSRSSSWLSPAGGLTPATPQPTMMDLLRSHSTWSVSTPPARSLTTAQELTAAAAAVQGVAEGGAPADLQRCDSGSTAFTDPIVGEASLEASDGSIASEASSPLAAAAFRPRIQQSPFARSYNFSDLTQSVPEGSSSQ